MYSFKEKKTHFVALRNPDAARYDLELLAKEAPAFQQLATFSRNPKRYADDILYALLDCATREKIREYRRTMMAKEQISPKQQVSEEETTHAEGTSQHDDVEKPETAPSDDSTEELKQTLEEAEARVEEAEQRANEAEEAKDEAEARAEEAEQRADEAEARAEETEQALEEEKKKEPAKASESKSKKNTRKSTGTTSSTRKSK
ncbi:alanine-zipper protein [uncultured Bacteroides sp.]|uniref:alanine-zipper protein n=1 Tax=uncultured Bacteroides sp. TaxID=162156 RepID=UPI00280B11DC|nr:hypothetical protein [uncultured Bacteroides sp.]